MAKKIISPEKKKELAKTKFNKDMLKGILIGKPNQFEKYRYINLVLPIEQILDNKQLCEGLKMLLRNTYKKMKEGEVLLNTNIPAQIVESARLTDEA